MTTSNVCLVLLALLACAGASKCSGEGDSTACQAPPVEDAAHLMQNMVARKSVEKKHGASHGDEWFSMPRFSNPWKIPKFEVPTSPPAPAVPPNLVVFLDGSGDDMSTAAECTKALNPTWHCFTNIPRLYNLAKDVGAKQKAYYEPGVGSHEGDDFNFGVGTKRHMLHAYDWLAENYVPGSKIFVFGFSRGALSARMLQGMIHRVGLSKADFRAAATQTQFHGSDKEAADFKASDKVFSGVDVQFLGLFDAVLRTLLHPDPGVHSNNIKTFSMKLTPSVKNFAHAIALSEYREIFQANELYVDPSTKAKQVWFQGMHSDVGGGRENVGAANIANGWLADQAIDAGLILPDGWAETTEMQIDPFDDLAQEQGIEALGMKLAGINLGKMLEMVTVRNPARCRKERGLSGKKILFHKSVKDRMEGNKGWVPLSFCCAGVKAAMDSAGIDYVSNPAYDRNLPQALKAKNANPPAHWMKIKFGKLKNAEVPTVFENPDYMLKVTSWHSSQALPAGEDFTNSASSVTFVPLPSGRSSSCRNVGSWYWPRYLGYADFSGAEITIPYEDSVADSLVVEVQEDDVIDDDWVGRAVLKFSDNSLTQMKARGIGGDATIEVQVEYIRSDEAASGDLGGGSDPAACKWLDRSTGMPRDTVCEVKDKLIPRWIPINTVHNMYNAKECDDFIEDTEWGSL